ncbi:MAG: response regulator [Deltaproteobacteria bacterium]|nr:response regulator [Deltaproteobacteria bacterium]
MAACVLVVDDDDVLRDTVAEALEDAGYLVERAENGREALVKMRLGPPCIVLLDLMMPVMDGWEVVTEMDRDPRLAGVPVCVVSAQDRIAPPRNIGVLRKPASLAALLTAVEAHCGKPPAA